VTVWQVEPVFGETTFEEGLETKYVLATMVQSLPRPKLRYYGLAGVSLFCPTNRECPTDISFAKKIFQKNFSAK
jgi:hypothetical protein